MKTFEAEARISCSPFIADASLVYEELEASGCLCREELEAFGCLCREGLEISGECVCWQETNALFASDGALYTSECEPLFVTE